MRKIKKIISLIVLLSTLYVSNTLSQEHTYFLEFSCTEYANTQITLAFYYGKSIQTQGKLTLSKEGAGRFEQIDHQGILLLIISDSIEYELLLSEPGIYSLSRQNSSWQVNSNAAGEAFANFNQQNAIAGASIDSLRDLYANIQGPEKHAIRNEIKQIRSEVNRNLNSSAMAFKGSLAGNYFNALQAVKIPDFSKTDSLSTDSLLWLQSINYYRNHFLDNINWTDSKMVYTPVIEEKLESYFRKVVPHTAIGQSSAIDSLLHKSLNDTIQKFVLQTLLKIYKSTLTDPVSEYAYIYLIEHYFIENTPSWAEPKLMKALGVDISLFKPTALGSKAPQLRLPDKNKKTCSLGEKEAEAYILLFWDYSCPACQRILTEFRKVVLEYNYKDIRVYTVFTGSDQEVWEAWLARKLHPDWINTTLDGNNHILKDYRIERTPTLFLLNKNLEIIDKEFSVRELEEYLLKVRELGG